MSRSCHSATSSSAACGVAAQHAREPGELLGLDRVSLVRHRARSPSARRGTAPPPRAPRCAAGGAARSRSAPARRRPARSPAAARRDGRVRRPAWRRLALEAQARQHARLELRARSPSRCRPRPRSRRRTPARTRAPAARALRCASNAKPASLIPNEVGSACTPCVRPTHSVSACSRARSASARDERVGARHDHLARALELQRQRRVEHVAGRQPVVDPAPGRPGRRRRARRRTRPRRGRSSARAR